MAVLKAPQTLSLSQAKLRKRGAQLSLIVTSFRSPNLPLNLDFFALLEYCTLWWLGDILKVESGVVDLTINETKAAIGSSRIRQPPPTSDGLF
jgi:hypothetical protein